MGIGESEESDKPLCLFFLFALLELRETVDIRNNSICYMTGYIRGYAHPKTKISARRASTRTNNEGQEAGYSEVRRGDFSCRSLATDWGLLICFDFGLVVLD